jgi:biofilm PGA synthesis N-glycosyltransferase PgaC
MVNGILAHESALPPRSGELTPSSGPARLTIVLVACFLNEEEHLSELLVSLAGQTRRPDSLLLVDDGSTDDSPRLATRFASANPWATVLRRPRRPAERDRLASAAELHAFQWAVGQVSDEWDVIAKLDADIRFNPRLLETIERRFLADAGLGIAGSHLSVVGADGALVREHCPPDHVRGATKFYRRGCYEAVAPLPGILGWDTIDEITARMHGWRTATFATPGGDSLHLRPTATRDGALRGYRRVGECAWGYGAHPLHVTLGTLARLARRPRLLGGLNYAIGWAAAGLRHAARASAQVRAFGRREQLRRMLSLPAPGARR